MLTPSPRSDAEKPSRVGIGYQFQFLNTRNA